MEWEQYAESVRDLMSNEFDFTKTEGTFEERMKFVKEQVIPLQQK